MLQQERTRTHTFAREHTSEHTRVEREHTPAHAVCATTAARGRCVVAARNCASQPPQGGRRRATCTQEQAPLSPHVAPHQSLKLGVNGFALLVGAPPASVHGCNAARTRCSTRHGRARFFFFRQPPSVEDLGPAPHALALPCSAVLLGLVTVYFAGQRTSPICLAVLPLSRLGAASPQ